MEFFKEPSAQCEDGWKNWKPKDLTGKTSWRGTDFNIGSDRLNTYKSWEGDVNRMVISLEYTQSGKEHYQIFITWVNAKRFSAMVKMAPNMWWAPAYVKDAAYEKKMGSIILFEVDNRKPGERTELYAARDRIIAGASKRQMWEEHYCFMLKHSKMYNEIRSNLVSKAEIATPEFPENKRWIRPDIEEITKSKVIVFHGAAGIGKTEAINQWLEGLPILTVSNPDDLQLFQVGETQAIIFDDFDPTNMNRNSMLTLFEQKQERHVRIRYTQVTIPKQTVKIICTNRKWWPSGDPAFERRIHQITVTEEDNKKYGYKFAPKNPGFL